MSPTGFIFISGWCENEPRHMLKFALTTCAIGYIAPQKIQIFFENEYD